MTLRAFLLMLSTTAFAFFGLPSRLPGQEASRKPTAQEYLAAVFKRYGQMTSYRDAGQVRLITAENGKRVERVAPMRVAFAPSEFAMQVYDVRAETVPIDSDVGIGVWFVDAGTRLPSIKTLHDQVLTRRGRGDGLREWLPDIFADPILASRMAAGLAGPPPQLDWLLAEEPMAALFVSRQTIRYVDRQEVEGRACRIIDVRDSQAAYRFYVDERDYLIRRVDLPRVVIQPTGDAPPETIDLVIELKKAQYNQGNRPLAWQAKLLRERPDQPHEVTQFVPPPPPEPPRHWGRRPKQYEVVDEVGNIVLSWRGGTDRVSIVIPEVDADSEQLAQTLKQWVENQDEETRHQMQLVALGYQDRAAAIALGMAPSPTKPADRIGVVDSNGTLVWSSPVVDPAVMNGLTGVVADMLADIDVVKRVRRQWATSQKRYLQATGRSASSQ